MALPSGREDLPVRAGHAVQRTQDTTRAAPHYSGQAHDFVTERTSLKDQHFHSCNDRGVSADDRRPSSPHNSGRGTLVSGGRKELTCEPKRGEGRFSKRVSAWPLRRPCRAEPPRNRRPSRRSTRRPQHRLSTTQENLP